MWREERGPALPGWRETTGMAAHRLESERVYM